MVPDPMWLSSEEPKTLEHLLHACANCYSKTWELVRHALTLALSHPDEGIYSIRNPHTTRNCIQQTPPLSSPSPSRKNTGKVIILFLPKVKCDIRHTQLKTPWRQSELQLRIQAHLPFAVSKIHALLAQMGKSI
jgi:hypothetical protein